MTPRRISVAEPAPGPAHLAPEAAMRVVIVTMDDHLAIALVQARTRLARTLPGLELELHVAADWAHDPGALLRCRAAIARAHVVIAAMLFLEEHFRPILPDLEARRDELDALLGILSAPEVTRLTRLGRLAMDGGGSGALGLLKRLRGERKDRPVSGARQMAMLRRLPQLLRFIPGKAQDLRAYFLAMQYWLAGSAENLEGLVHLLVDRYARGPRAGLRGRGEVAPPAIYPEIGVYHPRLPGRIGERAEDLPRAGAKGTVGLLLLRSYLLAGNSAHYDGVIGALEAQGLSVIPVFAAGLDARPAIERYFLDERGGSRIDALVSLTGFSLVGGPAYNDAKAGEEILARLDVPYIAAQPAELQPLERWAASERGLLPVESTIMVAIPELDGATGPIVFGGRSEGSGTPCEGCERHCRFEPGPVARTMQPCLERAHTLAARVARLVALRRTPPAERRLAIVLFCFPPNAGAVGTAAYLGVFESLHNTLRALAEAGWRVELPESVEALRRRILEGNAARFGTPANVHARIPVDQHVRRERHLAEIEAQWGPAPGRQQSDGKSLFVLGERFDHVFVGVQPAMGYEGDPMRLLFARGFAPTHAFAAFYRWLAEDFGAHAVLHFGTHGALEFMPGKQTGLSARCWPDRLIGTLPNFYLYAANNPSEGLIAKRRSAATLVSYLTPPLTHAGLYRGLAELKASLERFRALPESEREERRRLAELIQAQAAAVELAEAEPAWPEEAIASRVQRLGEAILELETTLVPHGLHVVGKPPSAEERVDLLLAVAEANHGAVLEREVVERLVAGRPTPELEPELARELRRLDALLARDHELEAIVRALDGRFVRPVAGGDLLRDPSILPTGRNLHGFDPFRIPSAFAMAEGARQVERLLARHLADGHPLPETVALVLWGTDNLKTEGAGIAQALALLGARPRFDSYGRLAGAELVPLVELGRPRIDVVLTLSGIFRDLLPLQTRMLAEAAWLAAAADEPVERNFVKKHALAHQARLGCDLETAALRVFSNAEGAYGANVNLLIDSGSWAHEDELAETWAKRKGFAYGRDGRPVERAELLERVLAHVELAYQNLESVELGVTAIDQYVDSLGGLGRAAAKARGTPVPVYIGDPTRGAGTVRTLAEQVALEARTRLLNPKWYEGMLRHGYEGVRQIEAHVTAAVGWSATTGQVAPWVYEQVSRTFLLDPEMRERLARLNPTASARVASRLLEAHDRRYWQPDPATLEALRRAGEDLEDRLEGIGVEMAA
jgi:magnesium chelatase subunit H